MTITYGLLSGNRSSRNDSNVGDAIPTACWRCHSAIVFQAAIIFDGRNRRAMRKDAGNVAVLRDRTADA